MLLSLGQAAKLAGKGKTTLTRAIRSGKLSAKRRDDGTYAIDVAELSRVYDIRLETPETVTRDRHAAHHATPGETVSRDPETVARLATLEAENRMLRELLDQVKQHRDELRTERDDWKARAERLLTDRRPPPIPRAPPTPRQPASERPRPKPAPADAGEETAAEAAPAERADEPQVEASPEHEAIARGMAEIRRKLELQMARRKLEELGDYDS